MVVPWEPPWNVRQPDYITDASDAETLDEVIVEEQLGEVWLDEQPIPILGNVRYSNLATFDNKLVIGDYTRDSDDLMSARVYANFRGGGQIYIETGSDSDRYWTSTLMTQYPFQLSLNRWVEAIAPPEPAAEGLRCLPLGDLNGIFWVAWGNRIYGFDPTTEQIATTTTAVLTDPPIAKPVLYNDALWIPLGTSVAVFTGSSTITYYNTIPAMSLCVWDDNVLYALAGDGQLRSFTAGSWQPVNPDLRVRNGTPRFLAVFSFRDEPVLHIATSRGLWALDPGVPRLLKTSLQVPPHPYSATVGVEWQADFYMAHGVSVYRYTGSTISPMGLDRDDGLPAKWRGAIIDLVPELNGLYAYLRGMPTPPSELPQEVIEFDPGLANEPDIILAEEDISSTVMVWTAFGWHTLWESETSDGTPSWMMLTAADEEAYQAYGLTWGYGDHLYRCPLPVSGHTPREGLKNGEDRFAERGVLETARFDFNMKSWPKIVSHVVLEVASCPEGCGVEVFYRKDGAGGWASIGQVTTPGRHILQIGPTMPVLGVGAGVRVEDIQFQLVMWRPPEQIRISPILDSFTVKLIKEPMKSRAWEMRVPIPAEGDVWNGFTGRYLSDFLDQCTRAPRFFSFVHDGQRYRVRIAYLSGENQSGVGGPKVRTLSVIEVPTDTSPLS